MRCYYDPMDQNEKHKDTGSPARNASQSDAGRFLPADYSHPPYIGKQENTTFNTLMNVVMVLGTAFVIRYLIVQPFVVQGKSMEPTFHGSEYLIVDKITSRLGRELVRGDIIVFRAPNEPRQNYIKRIIGLPGEKVTIQNGEVSVDGRILSEPYIALDSTRKSSVKAELSLGPNDYFVLGDNRDHSSDSRSFGALPKKNIIGRVWLTIFPVNEFGTPKLPTY